MAELVDALVSNTSGVKSIPVRSRVWVHRNACKSTYKRFSFVGQQKGSKKIKIELKSGIIHKKTGLPIDAKTTVQPNVFSKTHHFKGNSLLVSKRLLSLWEFLKIKN